MVHQIDHQAYIVKKIYQIDNHSFAIIWGDDVVMNYRLKDLQDQCPCANCVDEKTDRRVGQVSFPSKDDVRASNITNVGRYALRIQFLTGCSRGIFGFDMLRGKLN
jgi:DUF971 family protein